MHSTKLIVSLMLALTASAAPAPKASSTDCVILGHTIPRCDIVAYLKSLGIVDVPLVGGITTHGSNTTLEPSHNNPSGSQPSHNTTNNLPPPHNTGSGDHYNTTGDANPHHNTTGNHEPMHNITFGHPTPDNTTHGHDNSTHHDDNMKHHQRRSPFDNFLAYIKTYLNNLLQKVYLPDLQAVSSSFVKHPSNSTTSRLNLMQSLVNAVDSALMYVGLGGKGGGLSTSEKSNINGTLFGVLHELQGLNTTNTTLSGSQRQQLARLESSLQATLGRLSLEKRDGRSTFENA